jgi:poly(A) polymerase
MFKKALKIVKTLKDFGYEAYCAGGFVRDMLLGIESNDIDIATNALPEQVESLFPKTLAVGKSFGVIVVIIDDQQFEVATFRSDNSSSDGRHPDSVAFASIQEDARRRDLTINGMYYNPLTNEIIDLVGGQTDLRAKLIRFIGDPKQRIAEDHLRLMRVVRFAARFDFEIEEESFKATKENSHLIHDVSSERIADELIKILSVKNKRRAIELLFETGIVNHILPELVVMKGCEQPAEFHSEGDCLQHTILALSNLPEDASSELLMATLLHDIGKPSTQTFEDRIRFSCHDTEGAKIAENILRRLKLSNEFIEHAVALVKNHMKFMHVKDMRISRLKRFMNLPKFEEHLALHKADCMSSHEKLDNYDFIVEKLKGFVAEPEKNVIAKLPRLVTGNDLLSLGFVAGPLFRTILTDVEDQLLEGALADKEDAIKYVTEKYLATEQKTNDN